MTDTAPAEPNEESFDDLYVEVERLERKLHVLELVRQRIFREEGNIFQRADRVKPIFVLEDRIRAKLEGVLSDLERLLLQE